MSEDPLVTVVMPAFNAEGWIGKAISSVIHQTERRWELIVVDDGSNDGTKHVVETFRDPRVRLFSQENTGCYHARNVGLANARGEYIALLDADDWYEPDHLAVATSFLEKYPECALVGTNFYFIKHNGERRLGCKPMQIRGEPGDGLISDYFLAAMRNRCYPITNCAVFRKHRLRDLGPFDDSLLLGGDHEFWTRWAMRSQFGYIDAPTCYYRVDVQGSARKDLGKSIRMRVQLWKKLIGLETSDLSCWESYSKCRSFYVFRLIALAIAAGYFEEAEEAASMWPRSPQHHYWWMGQILARMPRFVHRGIHGVLGRMHFVRHRQGRPVSEGEL